VEAVNPGGKAMSERKSITLALQPPVPKIETGTGSITVSWEKVPFADSYKVYYGTDPASPGTPYRSNITGETSIPITGLINDTTYYVWVEAVNANGSKMSERKSITLTLQPPVPELEVGNGSITVSWEKDPLADSYNVYRSTDPAVPGTPYQSNITEKTSVPIIGLINGTTYYVWVEAVNAKGSKMSEATSGVPKLYSVEYTVNSEADFTEAVTGINASLKEGEYHITIGANITTSNVSFSATSTEKTIIIEGDTSVRTISNNGSYNLLTVNDSNILILQNNITLNGNNKTYRAVQVNKGGTLVMKTGSRITGAKDSGVHTDGSFTMEGGEISGNTSSKTGGGVYAAGGAFTMSGGTISGNTVSGGGGGGVFVSGATFTMSGGKITGNRVSGVGGGAYIGSNGTFTMTGGEISENTASGVGGGGVSVAGTFTMSGGTISGNKAPSGNGGGVSSASGRFIKSGGGTISSTNTGSPGRVVYVSASKRRETTAGPGVYMDSQVNGSAGGWE
jgi:hypothetical protein